MAELLMPQLPPGGATGGELLEHVETFLSFADPDGGPDDLLDGKACIVTAYKLAAKERISLTYALGDCGYLDYLGPSAKSLQVSGFCIGQCNEDGGPIDVFGWDELQQFYTTYRHGNRLEPLWIMLGSCIYYGFLVAGTLEGISADQSPDLHRFTMEFIVTESS